MTHQEYVEQEKARSSVHFSDGIWWTQPKPLFCWPLDMFTELAPGKVKPSYIRSFVGYQHAVSPGDPHNAVMTVMFLEEVSSFSSLSALPSKKRNQVRKAQNLLELVRIKAHEDLIHDGFEINQSALIRQGWAGAHPVYSNKHKWKEEIERTLPLHDRPVWGAYVDRKLVAYMRTIILGDRLIISSTMSHSDFLDRCPNDGLLFTALHETAAEGIRTATFGLPSQRSSLNEFKERFGFVPRDFPIFRWINPLVKPVMRFTRFGPILARTQCTYCSTVTGLHENGTSQRM